MRLPVAFPESDNSGTTQLKPFIRIIRSPYEEPYHLNLLVTASNGHQQGELEIYCNTSDLDEFSRALSRFPQDNDCTATWELGSEIPEDRFAFYYRLRALRLSRNGHCALELRFCNNREPPLRATSEFSIEAMPADLDRLALLLAQLGKLQHTELEWNVSEGTLR